MVGLSGGVDSAVSALLLVEAGYEVHGLFMKNWEEDDRDGHCSAAVDLEDVEKICARLDIPLHTRNFSAEYWDNVFEEFLAEYRAGRTPNPDVLCNREIKFKTFVEHAQALGADLIATGHYARICNKDGERQLCRGLDANKDQSYFLYAIGQSPLRHTLFPVGELPKPEVRKLAKKADLPVHAKKDSTGICFIGERNFKDFLAQYLPAQPGDIVDADGKILGSHQGLMYHTLGQRKGLGIGGMADSGGDPWYVAAKELETNRLVIVQGDHPLLYSEALEASNLHWIADKEPGFPLRCTAKTRYRQPDQACTIHPCADGRLRVEFEQPQRAVTPGQSVVFYTGEICLGGGTIEKTFRFQTDC